MTTGLARAYDGKGKQLATIRLQNDDSGKLAEATLTTMNQLAPDWQRVTLTVTKNNA